MAEKKINNEKTKMNKKILVSLSVIAAVAAIAIGGTIAYFSDTETSAGNTFSTGVIDIKIDEQNPWTESWNIVDMKPCETGYITFNIQNPGDNPVNIWKTIKNITTSDGTVNEPECVAQSGAWVKDSQGVYYCTSNVPKSNLHDWMNYDLSVRVPIPENKNGAWWQTIYKEDENVKVGNINGKPIFLGMVPAGGSMKVTQSYHLIPETENWAQADTMKFDIEIYAEQLKGELILENKRGYEEATGDWDIVQGDDIDAKLTYNLTGPTFDYDLNGKVKLFDTDYSLIYYADPWPGDGQNHDGTGVLIGKGTSTGGTIAFAGSVELNRDLPKWPSDQNHPEGAKIWLVPSDDYTVTTPGVAGNMQAWNPENYLFETALITYDDTDI